jgi:hypothetical protein
MLLWQLALVALNEANLMWVEHPPQDDGMLPRHNAEQVDLMEAPPIGMQHSCCLFIHAFGVH